MKYLNKKVIPAPPGDLILSEVREANRDFQAMADTPNLGLPYILAAQSQKHVTHNEAIRALDAIVQLNILDRNLSAPPASPVEGDRYLVAAGPTGVWAGQAGKVAAFQDGAWIFYAPKEGWLAWIADENVALAYDGGAWVGFSGGGGGATTFVASPIHRPTTRAPEANSSRSTPARRRWNSTTRFRCLASTRRRTPPISLAFQALPHSSITRARSSGEGQQDAAADTASFLFQTAFSGRAEMGTTGDDNFHFKVSPDGTTWKEALIVDKTTGACSFPFTTSAASATATRATSASPARAPSGRWMPAPSPRPSMRTWRRER